MRYALTRTGVSALSIVTLVLVLIATSFRFSPYESPDYSWIRFEDTTWRDHPSSIVNEIPGFYVIDNACYNQKTFCERQTIPSLTSHNQLISRSVCRVSGELARRRLHQPPDTPILFARRTWSQGPTPLRLDRCVPWWDAKMRS